MALPFFGSSYRLLSICRNTNLTIYMYKPTGPSIILRLTKTYMYLESMNVKQIIRDQETANPYPNRNFRCMELKKKFGGGGGGLVKMIYSRSGAKYLHKQYLYTELKILTSLNITLNICVIWVYSSY